MSFKSESDVAQKLHGELMSYDKMVFLQVVRSRSRHVIVSLSLGLFSFEAGNSD